MKYAIISGYFAPLHSGHLDNLIEASKYGKVIVIVNNDKQLIAKRGKAFIDQKNRKNIMQNIKNVKEAIVAVDKDSTVIETLKLIRKKYPKDTLTFCKGGDRTNGNTPEQDVCKKLNIKVVFNIGGGKTFSSRDFLRDWTIWSKKLTKEQMKKYNLNKEI